MWGPKEGKLMIINCITHIFLFQMLYFLRFWVRPIFLERNKLGAGSTLIEEMRLNPENRHFNFFRMNSELFDNLLKLVEPHITKSDLGREPISPRLRLALTLRYAC